MRAPLLAATALLLAACAGNGEPPAAKEERKEEEVASLPPPPEARLEEKPPAETARGPVPAAGDGAQEKPLPPREDPPPAPDPPSDAVELALGPFTQYLASRPESQGVRNQVAEIARHKDPRVAQALKPLLRHKDDDVRIAVARCIGEQGDPSVAALLVSLADGKGMKEKPLLHAALLEGIGEADGKGHYKYLIKTAKKHLDTDPLVAAAAQPAPAPNRSPAAGGPHGRGRPRAAGARTRGGAGGSGWTRSGRTTTPRGRRSTRSRCSPTPAATCTWGTRRSPRCTT